MPYASSDGNEEITVDAPNSVDREMQQYNQSEIDFISPKLQEHQKYNIIELELPEFHSRAKSKMTDNEIHPW
jgi:hypothetical protein